MTKRSRRAPATALALALLAAAAWGQSDAADGNGDNGGDSLDALFDAEMIEDQPGDEGGDAAADRAGAGDPDALFDEDLFDEEMVATEAATGGAAAAPEQALLTSSAGVEWGGSFRYAPEVELSFPNYDAVSAALRGERAAERALRHDLAAQLYFDARPDRDFRVFGKAKVDYALPVPGAPAGAPAGGAAPANQAGAGASAAGRFEFTMFELFADFHWEDRIFFRAGKQRADWGVGRFFSPADLMSLVTIDPLDPEAEREGPVALKVHAPIGVHNAYLYLITGDYRDPLDVAAGARAELVIEGVELGAGGMIQADLVPKAFATATGAAGDFDLFGELVIQRGTERNRIELDAAGGLLVTGRAARADEWFPAATAGASYRSSDPNVVLAAQYYYNPLGYPDSAALGSAREALNASAGAGPPRTGPKPEAVDLLFFGNHYAGASAAWNGIADSDLDASLFWLANLSDGSGILRPLLSYQVLEYARLSAGARVGYGTGATEYGEFVAITLGAALGVGSF